MKNKTNNENTICSESVEMVYGKENSGNCGKWDDCLIFYEYKLNEPFNDIDKAVSVTSFTQSYKFTHTLMYKAKQDRKRENERERKEVKTLNYTLAHSKKFIDIVKGK